MSHKRRSHRQKEIAKTEKVFQIAEDKAEKWISPSKGVVSYDKMIESLVKYAENNEDCFFQIGVGTDSQRHGDTHKFTSCITIRAMHDKDHGRGGSYFYRYDYFEHISSIKQKIIMEAAITLTVAQTLAEALLENDIYFVKGEEATEKGAVSIQLHFDVSETADSKVALKDVIGMASGSGFEYEIKPHSFVASCIADKHSK